MVMISVLNYDNEIIIETIYLLKPNISEYDVNRLYFMASYTLDRGLIIEIYWKQNYFRI